MSRFKFRDLLWLTAMLGLVICWSREMSQRKRESTEIKRLHVVMEEQALDFQNVEQHLLDKDENEARRFLTNWAPQRATKRESIAPSAGADEPLIGEWEVVELIENGKTRDFQGEPSGSIKIAQDRLGFWNQNGSYDWYRCDINTREIDISFVSLFLDDKDVLKGLYELKGDKLCLILADVGKPRPTDFNALNNKELTLYVLKKKVP